MPHPCSSKGQLKLEVKIIEYWNLNLSLEVEVSRMTDTNLVSCVNFNDFELGRR